MEKMNQNQEVWKGVEFWTNEIKNAGVYDKIQFFNDVVTENRPPHPEAGFHKVVSDIILDGMHCDVYHTDEDENGKIEGHTFHRIFIHKKHEN